MILDRALLVAARKTLKIPWQVFCCDGCGTKIDSRELADWDGSGDLPPGWFLRVSFHTARILCPPCLLVKKERAQEKNEDLRVYARVSGTELEGDYGMIPSTRVECARCEHAAECFGTSERSVSRAMIMLRDECPREESNFYTDDPLGAVIELCEDEEDEDDQPTTEDNYGSLPRVSAALEGVPRERALELLDELEHAIPSVVKTITKVRDVIDQGELDVED